MSLEGKPGNFTKKDQLIRASAVLLQAKVQNISEIRAYPEGEQYLAG